MENTNSEERSKILEEPIDKKVLFEIGGSACYSKIYNCIKDWIEKNRYDHTKSYLIPNKDYLTKKDLIQLQYENNFRDDGNLSKGARLVLERYLQTIKDKSGDYKINKGVLIKMGISKWREDSYGTEIIYELGHYPIITNGFLVQSFLNEKHTGKAMGDKTIQAAFEYLRKKRLHYFDSFPARGFGIEFEDLPVNRSLEKLIENGPKAVVSAQIKYDSKGCSLKRNIFSVGIVKFNPPLLYFGVTCNQENKIIGNLESINLEKIIQYRKLIEVFSKRK